jgi:integrase
MPKREKKLPVVLTRKEAHQILSCIEVLRHRACLSRIYVCALRLGEGCGIELTDIDRARGLLHVRGGKGAKDRYVPLPASILPLLEEAWRSHRHPRWLFASLGELLELLMSLSASTLLDTCANPPRCST